MKTTLLHIFRNSPTGRENLMQSAYFCKQQFGLSLAVYIPETAQFCMDFGGNPVSVQLDGSYVAYPSTARQHAEEALVELKCTHQSYVPVERIGGAMPLLPNEGAMMTCPRVISEDSSRIGLGHRLISELVFGSKLEAIQATLPNPLDVVGPDCRAPWDHLPESET